MNKTRTCKGCGRGKSTLEFDKGKQFCLLCGDGARERAVRESRKRYSRKYRAENPDKARSESRKSKAKQYYSDDPYTVLKYLLGYCKGRAKSRSYEFDLDAEFLFELYNQQDGKCAVTGLPFIFEKSDFEKRPFAPSIDRINCSKGYTKNNVRLVCGAVNIALNEYGDAVFDKICNAYINNKDNSLGTADV